MSSDNLGGDTAAPCCFLSDREQAAQLGALLVRLKVKQLIGATY
jgi:hypothetical protein